MAAKLKNLIVRKVDFVEEGANPDAHIRMLKRKNREGKPKEVENSKGVNILKKLFGFIGKAAGIDQSEIDNAVDEIQKGSSVSFHEKINEFNNRKIADEMWDVCYALQSSLYSILNDEEMDSSSVAEAMQESLDEFYAVVKESISKWSNGNAASIMRKEEEASKAEIEIMKAAVERLNQSIEKADNSAGEDELDKKENQEGDKETMGMKIDKSKLTEAEKAFLESIEKRYSTEDGAAQDKRGTMAAGASTGQTPPPASEEPTVIKSIAQPAAETTPTTHTEDTDSIYKGLHPAVRAELEGLKKFREDAEERELTEVAKKYTIIGKKEEELLPLFKSLKAAGGTAYNDMIAVLDQAVAAVEKSGAFSEIGKSGHGSMDGSAWAEADAKATELMKSKAGLSKAQALDEVFLANPELAEKCEKEE